MINSIRYKLKKQDVDPSLPLINRLLSARDLSIDQLQGSLDDLYDPYLINDMEIAVQRISEAIRNKEKTIIYGDYDVDGIMSTVILKKGLSSLGLECDYYIPERLVDGYGMNMQSIFEILEKEYSLVITVDCGITGFDEIDYLQENGVDVIITDHHECKDVLPEAMAVLDNKRPDSTYPFTEICGAGVAFKLLTALFSEYGKDGDEREYVKYVAMATVCDVMPLIDENRILVKEGIEQIKLCLDPAFKNLLRVAGKLENVDEFKAQDIAFYLGPLINASSRVGNIKYAMNLFLDDNEEHAISNSDKLRIFNEQRKEIEKEIFAQAQQQIISSYNFDSFAPIVVYGDDWHRGIIGIVASKIVEKYDRPVIILSRKETDKSYHGSCRTYGDINIMDILRYAEAHIEQYGGHAGAAGLTIGVEQLPSFISKVKEYASINFNQTMFLPCKTIDIEIQPEEITLDNYNRIQALEPFGEKNEEPVFICKNLRTKVIKRVGTKQGSENAHLKISFSPKDDSLKNIDGIGFFIGDYGDILPSGKLVDVVFTLSSNTWNDKTTVQLMVKDILYTPVYKEGLTEEEDELYRDRIVRIKDIIGEYSVTEDELLPNKNEYIAVYKMILKLLEEPNNSIIITNLNYLSGILSTRLNYEFNPFKVSRILEVLGESNNITFKHMLFDQILITKPPVDSKRIQITTTSLYKRNHGIK